ncbi:alpha/beta hydrolase, partial [Streptomyces sp. MBT65]|uniref:alpha/beta fold hydrolase n=1 Tax=Streptomyces sp. MBT65 TaxID=1488395 RepID=UPI00190C555A
ARTVALPGGLSVTIQEFGENTEGTGVLILHGGAGPRTVAGISNALSEHVYVVTPTHPGFDGTPRPERFDTVADLAIAYLDLLDTLDLKGVMVVGNSVGGWIAAEMALRDNQGRIGALTLLNAVGIHAHMVENRVVDPRTMAPSDISQLSFAGAEFRPDFASFTDEQRSRGRLHRVTVPVLVVWGEEDGIAPLKYGRGYADAFPNGHFAPIANAAHFPQIEQLGATLGAIGDFVSTVVKPGSTD